MSNNYSNCWSKKDLDSMRHSVSTLKKDVLDLFGQHFDHGLNTLKFHLSDHLVDDLKSFGTIHVLSESLNEH